MMNYVISFIIIWIHFSAVDASAQQNSLKFSIDECMHFTSNNSNTELDTLLVCKEMFIKYKRWIWYVYTNNLTSFAYYVNGENIKAMKHAELALEYSQKHLEKTDTNYLDALHNNAFFYSDRLLFKKAIEIYKEVIEIDKKLPAVKSENRALTYNGLAHVYRSICDFESAAHFFQKAIDLINDEGIVENLPAFYADLGNAFKLKGDTTEAIAQYQISLKLILENQNESDIYLKRVAFKCYTELSEIYLNENDIAKFNLFSGKAISLYEKFGKNLFKDFKYYELQGDLIINQKRFKNAINYYKNAEKALIEEQEGLKRGGQLAKLVSKQGNCYAQLNLYEKAIQTYQQALYVISKPFDTITLNLNPTIESFYDKRTAIEILSYKAEAFNKFYKNSQQLKYLQFANETYLLIADLIPITRRDFLEENSKFQLAIETGNIYESAIETCYQLYQLSCDKRYLEDAFFFAENSKAIVLQEAMQMKEAFKGLNDSLQQKDIKFKADIAFYENLIGTTAPKKSNTNKLSEWKEALFELKETYVAFKKKVETENPDYYSFKYATALANVTEIQNNLSNRLAIIEYFAGKKNIYIFTIEKDDLDLLKVSNTKQLKQDVDCLKEYVMTKPSAALFKNGYESYLYTANNIFHELLNPALINLSKKVRHLAIIPDKYLFNISFDALLTSFTEEKKEALYHPKNLRYLVEDYSVFCNYSASFFLKTLKHSQRKHSTNFIGYAPEFSNLFKNAEEVTLINQFFDSTIRIGNLANFQNFNTDIKESMILHLATHAQQNQYNHKLSEIHFSDTVITNYHIENIRTNADLTVLSACETGSGFIQSGEGAMSLSRSFFLAGCPSLVSSLWRANDESTAVIMLYFYQHLKAGANKDVSLQNAKLQYCEEAGIRESHPYYWAGFVQSGSNKALF